MEYLFTRYYKPLVLWAASFLNNIPQSEDLVQDLQENAVEEEQLLKEWLGHDPEHQRYFERFRRHHIHLQAAIQSGRIQGQYIEFASRLKRRHIRRLFIRVAAIALILLGGGLSFYLIHTPSLIPTLAEVPIHPGSSKAILHLSSGTP